MLESFNTPLEIINNNNACTLNILEACRKLNLKKPLYKYVVLPKFMVTSKKFQPITENNYISPINPYASSKAFQDIISQVYFKVYDLKIIITRMFTYLNPKRRNLFASNFAHQIIDIENNKIKFLKHGNLNSTRSILDIRDAMHSYWLAATKGKVGNIYNISGKYKITVKQFLEELKKIQKRKLLPN